MGFKMEYSLEIAEDLDKTFSKLAKKDKIVFESINKKIPEILKNPYHFKPLRAPMQNKRRVHIGSFVLIFKIDEERKSIQLLEFNHHDDAYL